MTGDDYCSNRGQGPCLEEETCPDCDELKEDCECKGEDCDE